MSVASHRVSKRDTLRNELRDELQMFASQLDEALHGHGDMPSPWRFDDWLNLYRDVYRPSGQTEI